MGVEWFSGSFLDAMHAEVIVNYPNLLRRYLATLIDITILWFAIFLATKVPLLADSVWAMAAAAIALAVVYEPLLTAFYCTVGQWVMGIRVRNYDTLQRINPLNASLRLCVKYFLGAISVLTIPSRKDRRAIHDLATNTIVISAFGLGHACSAQQCAADGRV